MSQVTEQSVRFQTALASIKLIQASAVLDLTEDDFDFLTSNKVWIATDRSRARRCVEACVYGTLDFVGYPRFPAPVEFIAAVIAYYVHPVNIQTACLIMEGAEFTENIINGVERPVKAAELFAFTLRVRAGNTDVLTDAEENVRQKLRAEGVNLNAKGALTYTDIAGDPVLYGNLPPREISMKDVFRSGDSSKKFKIAEGQWYRYAPSYVSPAYHLLEGFPFIQEPPSGD